MNLKIRARSPQSNQIFTPSQQCIYVSSVKKHPLIQKIIHGIEATRTPTGSMPPSFGLGHKYMLFAPNIFSVIYIYNNWNHYTSVLQSQGQSYHIRKTHFNRQFGIILIKDICGYFQCAPFPRLQTGKVVWVLSFDP